MNPIDELERGDRALYDDRVEPLVVVDVTTGTIRLEGPRDGEIEVIRDSSAKDGYRARHSVSNGEWSNWYDIWGLRKITEVASD